jgi:hypothetical protein
MNDSFRFLVFVSATKLRRGSPIVSLEQALAANKSAMAAGRYCDAASAATQLGAHGSARWDLYGGGGLSPMEE